MPVMLEPYQQKIIELMERQESLLSEVYGIFAEKFPDHTKFWTKMAYDEKKHASIIKKLYDLIGKDNVAFDEGKIKTYTLNTFIAYVEKIKNKVETEDITILQALTYANDFEQSLVEKNIFSHFDSMAPKVKAALEALKTETEKHRDLIKNLKLELAAG
jgi:rubrerythrin